MHEVDKDDPNAGRQSSIFGIKVPFGRPVVVRDIHDVHTLRWGGFRKPRPKDDRDVSNELDLSKGGYTSARNTDDRGKFLLIFLVVPLLLVAVFGWSQVARERSVDATTSSCEEAGNRFLYTGTFEPGVFRGRGVTTFKVTFTDVDGRTSVRRELHSVPSDDTLIEVRITSRANLLTAPVTCDVRAVIGG